MEKNTSHHIKKVAKLRYKDEILNLHLNKKLSIREITKKINFKLSKTKLKTTLSKNIIHQIIRKYT